MKKHTLTLGRMSSVLLVVIFMLTLVGPAYAAAGDTTIISVSSSGVQSPDYNSRYPSISANGRYVVFCSDDTVTLVPGEHNMYRDIFMRDTVTGTTRRVSVSTSGALGNGAVDGDASISADGRYVAFGSRASNLVNGDTNGERDVFVRDTVTNTTTLVSVSTSGAQGDLWSDQPSISADGRYVAFSSSATQLVPWDTNLKHDIFVRDTILNTTMRVSVDSSSGAQANDYSAGASISADGRYVAFWSRASNLVAADTNAANDMFVRDTVANTTTRVSVDSNGNQSNYEDPHEASSIRPTISANGRYVAFVSYASNLVNGDTNGVNDVFVHDILTGTTTRVSVDSSGTQANEESLFPSISPDGRYVAFASYASNLVAGDTNEQGDAFVHDTVTGATTRVSVDSNGVEGYINDDYLHSIPMPSISTDGRYVAFDSYAGNLVTGDTNERGDIFMHETGVVTPPVDPTIPTVLSITRANPNPTNLASVDFIVTFSEPVTGVDTSDFTLTKTGSVSGVTVSGVSGLGSVYTATVNTGSGNGTIRLDVVDNNSIVDSESNPLGGAALGDGGFITGEVYKIIKTATFADAPLNYWAWQYIERLYGAGITSGCSVTPLNYCPENPVTRAQMAVFLLKGIHGTSYNPPDVGSDTGFTDVAINYWAAAWIKQLFAEGITGGCSTGIYCPEANVTRAQMAVFLLKAKHGSAYSPPAATGVFTDVPVGYWARNWIERLAAEGITSGCGTGVYCPEADVTRAQMAVFLVKTFNLP